MSTDRFLATDRAACAGVDTELFFPSRGAIATQSVRAAKRICARCPVTQQCLDYALTAQGVSGVYVDGVWGGTTSLERRRLRAARRTAA